jgi:hypothetical protein
MASPPSEIIAPPLRPLVGMAPVIAAVLALALPLMGCGGTVDNSVFDRLAESTPVPPPARAEAVVPTAEAMHGRWVLTMPGSGSCAMTFGAPAAAGGIAVEHGCPGKFAASRRWTIEPDGVAIRDTRGGALASFHLIDPGHLEGATPQGEQVLLAR